MKNLFATILIAGMIIFYSCSSTAFLTVKSKPEGAVVYIVPKVLWETDTVKYSDPNKIGNYIVKQGVTPLYTIELSQKEYAVIITWGDRKKLVMVDLVGDVNEDKAKTIEVDLQQ